MRTQKTYHYPNNKLLAEQLVFESSWQNTRTIKPWKYELIVQKYTKHLQPGGTPLKFG